jgi:hypothetical protein
VAGKVKKIFRDRGGVVTDEDRAALKLELGDVLSYWQSSVRSSTSVSEMWRPQTSEPGGVVLTVDRILRDDDRPHPGKTVDINMLFNLGGRERTLREFGDLVGQARLRIARHADTDLALGWLEVEALATI